MDRDMFLNPALHLEPSSQPHWHPMTRMPEMSLLTGHTAPDISRPNWENSDHFSQFESGVSSSTVSNIIVGKLNSPIMDHFVGEKLPMIRTSMPLDPNLPLLAADPGFAERAARFSCFGSRSFNARTNEFESNVSPVMAAAKLPRVASSPAMKIDRSPVNSNEESSVSEQVPSRELAMTNSKRKRGSAAKKPEENIDESKRQKKTEQEDTDKTKENAKPPEPPKDYIHVRARRGQATDSHSLAERVRREKISERMKLLQNLVPNCNKVTGKALMLDEIINYVQSLQRQVEFLSMKLATVDFATNDVMSQNINPLNGNLCQETSSFCQQELFNGSVPMTELTQTAHEFTQQLRGFGQDDLQSIVRMGFNQNLDLDTSFLHTNMGQPSNMKTEL